MKKKKLPPGLRDHEGNIRIPVPMPKTNPQQGPKSIPVMVRDADGTLRTVGEMNVPPIQASTRTVTKKFTLGGAEHTQVGRNGRVYAPGTFDGFEIATQRIDLWDHEIHEAIFNGKHGGGISFGQIVTSDMLEPLKVPTSTPTQPGDNNDADDDSNSNDNDNDNTAGTEAHA